MLPPARRHVHATTRPAVSLHRDWRPRGGRHGHSHVVPGEEAPSRATWIVQHADVITSTVRPIRCLTGLIEPEQAGTSAPRIRRPDSQRNSGRTIVRVSPPSGHLRVDGFAHDRVDVSRHLHHRPDASAFPPADEATIKQVKQQIIGARAARREAHALLEKAKQASKWRLRKTNRQAWRC